MLYSKKTDYLMESIRLGRDMARREKLNLIVGLSIPSMLAQISTVMMFLLGSLISLNTEYRVVDLPLPVGPVTSTMP